MQIEPISKIFASHGAALAALKSASPLLVSTDQEGGDHVASAGLDADGARFDVVLSPLTTPGVGVIPGPEMPDGSHGPDMPAPPTPTGEVQVDLYWQGADAPTLSGGRSADAPATAFESPPPTYPDFSPSAVKNECSRRIYSVCSDSAQKNILANLAAGLLSDADKRAFSAGVKWISDMQSACRLLIAAEDVTFILDLHWPPVPAGVEALALKF